MKDPLVVPGWLYNGYRFKVTAPARYLGYGLILASLGSVSVLIPVYQLFCGLLSLMLLAWIGGALLRPKVTITGQFPEQARCGQPVTGTFTVTNRSRWPVFDLALGLFDLPSGLRQENRDCTVAELPGRASVTIPVTLQTIRRGLYPLPDIRAYSLFPFHLVRSGRSKQSLGSLVVLPEFHPLSGIDLPAGTRYQPGGIALTSNVGESPEYIGNREYVPGEPARRLDFRSWARLGKPVVREYKEEYYCRIALVLDTLVPQDIRWGFEFLPDGRLALGRRNPDDLIAPNLEAAVSLAAAVAHALSNGEYLIDLFAAGPELYVFQSGRHTAHFEQVLEILACVGACREEPFNTVTPALTEELGRISSTVCVFLDWDRARSRLARAILEAGCDLKIVIVRDGPTTEPINRADFPDCRQLSIADIEAGTPGVL